MNTVFPQAEPQAEADSHASGRARIAPDGCIPTSCSKRSDGEVFAPHPSAIGPGVFVAIVGGSGVGKDSLLAYARAQASELVFVRRTITRESGAAEASEELSEAEFTERVEAGAFAVSWSAHGLGYGLPLSVDDEVRAGRIVVANVSRTVLRELASRYARLRVVRISVSPDIRSARLAARGRESEQAIAARIDRPDPAPDFLPDLELVNNGTLAETGDRLLNYLHSLS